MLSVGPPVIVLLWRSLIDRIKNVAELALNAPVQQELFFQFAQYLDRIVPICNELQGGRDSSPMLREIIEALIRDVGRGDDILKLCSNKSKIYVVTHCRSLSEQLEGVVRDLGRSLSLVPLASVQWTPDVKAAIDSLAKDLLQVQFDIKQSDQRICRLLGENSIDLQSDPGLQADLLLDLARSVGIDDASNNQSALKLQVELLKNDLQGTTEAYDLQMIDMLGQMVDNWTQSTDSISHNTDETSNYRDQKRIEPLYEAFICPLTKKIMSDPVTLENGQTYERSAIERWFRNCRENNRPIVCPTTGKVLGSNALKPSIALRHTIEEWISRNETIRIENDKKLLSSKISDQDVLHGLQDVQILCQKNKSNKHKVRNAGLIPIIVDCLKLRDQVRYLSLDTLRLLVQDEDANKEAVGETLAIRSCIKCLSRDDSKEKEAAINLLYELSKYQPMCRKIGSESGAILILVGIVSSNSDEASTIQKAECILKSLEVYDHNVRQMAENGRLQPLLVRLNKGGEEIRLEMANILAGLVLSKEGKAKAAEAGGKTLVEMLDSGYLAGREAALKSLCELSSLEDNAEVLIKVGILPALIRGLFAVEVNQMPMKLKEISATTLANVVSSGIDFKDIKIDNEGNTLTSETTIHNLLRLISNTGPAIEAKLVQVLVGLTSSPHTVGRVVMAIKSAGGSVSLIQFLEAPHRELRANSLNLLCHICPHMRQDIADGLVTTGLLGTLLRLLSERSITEEHTAAAKLLALLPYEDFAITRALLQQGALLMLLRKLDELCQGVSQVGARRYMNDYKEGIVRILVRFTNISEDHEMVALAQEYNLTSIFTGLLMNSENFENIIYLSATGLANLSLYSKQLSVLPDIIPKSSGLFGCFLQSPSKTVNLCRVHKGVCSAKRTFCLVQAQSVLPLVACLEHQNLKVVEAALKALSTLIMDPELIKEGISLLSDMGAVQPILDIMKEHKTQVLQQHAVMLVQCLLQDDKMAQILAKDLNVHTSLVEAFKYGNNSTKHAAEKALKHLNKIPQFSGLDNKPF